MKWALLFVATAAVATAAIAQDHSTMDHSSHTAAPTAGALPVQPGQAAFGAINEIVTMLDADPHTDWSRVNIEALRAHLIDMNELTLNAQIAREPIANGERYRVTGAGPTRDAIRRMIGGHVAMQGDMPHWTMTAAEDPQGMVVTVVGKQPSDVARIRGLGLIGMMATDDHHQRHHLMVARGAGMGH